MLKRIVWTAVVLGAAGTGVYHFCPGVSVRAAREVARWTGWNDEAQRADPAGFAAHVAQKLQHDIEVMERTRREMTVEVGQLSDRIRQERALLEQGRTLAAEFRDKYVDASAKRRFPIEVRGAAYTEPQAKSQVSMLLAEIKGYESSQARLEDVRQQAETQIQTLTVRINTNESELVTLAAKRGMLEARSISADGETLLAHLDGLLEGNARVIESNPIRPVRELLVAARSSQRHPTNAEAVAAFLTVKPAETVESTAKAPPARKLESVKATSPKPAKAEPTVKVTRNTKVELPIQAAPVAKAPKVEVAVRRMVAKPIAVQEEVSVAEPQTTFDSAQRPVEVNRGGSAVQAKPASVQKPASSKTSKPIFQQF